MCAWMVGNRWCTLVMQRIWHLLHHLNGLRVHNYIARAWLYLTEKKRSRFQTTRQSLAAKGRTIWNVSAATWVWMLLGSYIRQSRLPEGGFESLLTLKVRFTAFCHVCVCVWLHKSLGFNLAAQISQARCTGEVKVPWRGTNTGRDNCHLTRTASGQRPCGNVLPCLSACDCKRNL